MVREYGTGIPFLQINGSAVATAVPLGIQTLRYESLFNIVNGSVVGSKAAILPLSTEFNYPHRVAMGIYLLVLNGIPENTKFKN